MLSNSSSNAFPALQPSNLYSFYPYSLSHPDLGGPSRSHSRVNSIRGEAPLSPASASVSNARRASASSPLSSPNRGLGGSPFTPQHQPLAATSGEEEHGRRYDHDRTDRRAHRQRTRRSEALARQRAEKRALMGLRPAGLAMGRESEELDAEEIALDDERQNINMFGHRFLLPFGRRLTQMEMDAAPSPTPSEADHERRQEDRSNADPMSPQAATGGALPMEGQQMEEEDEVVDLDASIEDLDASRDDEEGEMDGEEEGEVDASMEEA